MTPRTAPRFALLLALVAMSCTRAAPPVLPLLPALPDVKHVGPVSFAEQVRPVLERRCVVCHSCYDAPCQLLLSSHEGIERGASKEVVYATSRLSEAAPTRLFIDAKSAKEWHARGFFPVLGDPTAAASPALLLSMLQLGRAQVLMPDQKLPASLPLDIDRPLTCPRNQEFAAYAEQHPFGGMPYGTAPLTDAELSTLVAWVTQGARVPETRSLPASATSQVGRWEAFLNGDSLKQRVTARYLYEHWFVAHLHFDDLPAGPFFRIVRSRTAPGDPIDEIATRRPYDDPGVERFWYRLQPLDETIVHKTHIVYPLGEKRMRRLTELFLDSDWQPTRLPSYAAKEASNPFVTFDQMPARSRYQYLLDDARYFVMTFIRGPVCRGQVAVDVIDDRFFVAFLDPDRDLSVVDPTFLDRAKKLLRLPAEHLSRLAPGEFWLKYGNAQRRYLELRETTYDAIDPQNLGPTLDYLWDGDGHNRNAQLTVFRHFDNAAVELGFIGAIPKTAWVMDFPIFERIYYNLVAGYDVFGGVTHQVATRLYMDHLRMQSENLFLAFLPPERRDELRASWYIDATNTYNYKFADRPRAVTHGTRIPFTSSDVKAELLDKIARRSAAVSGPPDTLNRCAAPPCDRKGASTVARRAERALQPLTGVRGVWLAELPELSYLRVRSADGKDDQVYSLIHDVAHTSVAFMFGEEKRLTPADDALTIAPGYRGSYPNFLFDVAVGDMEAFAQSLTAVQNASDFEKVAARWGVRRSSPRFWPAIDWVHENFRRQEPIEFGILDLDRYGNL